MASEQGGMAIPSMASRCSSNDGSEREREHGEADREICDVEEWRDSPESPDHRNNAGATPATRWLKP